MVDFALVMLAVYYVMAWLHLGMDSMYIAVCRFRTHFHMPVCHFLLTLLSLPVGTLTRW